MRPGTRVRHRPSGQEGYVVQTVDPAHAEVEYRDDLGETHRCPEHDLDAL